MFSCFVNFIKTSTGFDKKGACLHDVELINEHKNEVLEVKASGGIKSEEDALMFIEAGATRIGTSHGIDIVNGIKLDNCEKGHHKNNKHDCQKHNCHCKKESE